MRGTNTNRPSDEYIASLCASMEENGYFNLRWVDGKGLCGLSDYAYTCGIVIGLDHAGYVGRYCYPDRKEAHSAFAAWSGDGDPPGGWVKYKGAGEERLGPGASDTDREFWTGG